MIRGAFNERLQPMVVVEISNGDGQYHPVKALLDTGFTQHLTLPPDDIARLGLEYKEPLPMILANGQRIEAPMYEGYVMWFGKSRRVNVIAVGGLPLLGMPMIENCKTTLLAQPGNELLIEEIPQT